MTTRSYLILIASAGSAALLLGAFGFQMLGYAPCKMCLWQRWPHAAAIAIGALALVLSRFAMTRVILPLLGAAAAATTACIGVYHAGVEQGWWQGPTSCTSSDIGGMSAEDLLSQIMTAPMVRCDDIAWQLFGLSMAGWNALISFVLVAIWIKAALMPVRSAAAK